MKVTTRASRLCRLALAALPATASAHVKWFCSYDVTQTPKSLAYVASPYFFGVLAAFLALVFVVFLADGWVSEQWPGFELAGSSLSGAQEKLVRVGTAAFFLCTWTIGLNILTPELHTQAAWIFGVQFMTAFFTIWRRTCIVSASGICVVWMYGVTQYGFFHMLDYLYFLGLAAFLACTSLSSERSLRLRTPVMTGALAFSLIWTAIEKFLYPQWSQQVMEKHSHMMMGMSFGVFIIVAAFVEFTLSFYLATGRGMLRLGAFGLLFVFITAMPEFGPLDVVGHFPLIAILGVPFMSGDSALQRFWRLPNRGIAVNAAASCVLYVVTLAVSFGMYYGVQWMEYRVV